MTETFDTWPAHPVAELFPMMNDEELKRLADDIRENGLKNPAMYWYEKGTNKGWLIDGRNRMRAGELYDVVIPMKEWKGDDPTSWIISQNLHRRHLTPTQKSMVSNGVEEFYKKQAEARMLHTGESSEKGGRGNKKNPTQNFGEALDRHSRETEAQAASLLGISRETHRQGKKVLETGVPELVDMCKRDEVKVSTAAQIAKLPEEAQQKIVQQGPDTVKKFAKAMRELKPATKHEADDAEQESIAQAVDPIPVAKAKPTIVDCVIAAVLQIDRIVASVPDKDRPRLGEELVRIGNRAMHTSTK